MKNPLLPRILLLLVFGLGWLQQSAQAQCPIANTCTPGNAPSGNLIFGMGIYNVNVNNGAINHTTAGASQGYQNYSCTVGASLFASVAYPISIQTNPNGNENVRVWIDYNNDGTFHATNELAFSSLNAKVHTGTFTIPASAVKNQPLRMRVSADNFSSPLPTPCSTPQYSQAEDYRITVSANTNPPVAQFTANGTITCNGTVSFTDQSQNGPTTWAWNFDDPGSGANNTSSLQNPTHTFSSPGTYSVSLTVTNANGSNSITKTNYITYHTNVPVAATCTPATLNYCCGYGITNVNFGNGLMTNASTDGSAGYQDFTCTKSVTVMAGNTYPFALTGGTNPQDTRIYIDLNNNGSFADPNESIVQVLNQVNPSGTIIIPGTSFTNMPLRMRIVSDEIGSTFNSCSGIQSGQAEDYTIIIQPNPNPPVAQFTSNYATACDTTIQFTDQSTNAPTSWAWNFGDLASGINNTSTLKNPVHIYHNPGTYTVTLTATNANGSNSITKTNYITVMKPCLTYCPSTNHNNNNLHISQVSLSNLTHVSGAAINGYSDFTNQTAILLQGSSNTLSVTRGGQIFNSSVSAWIDLNRNGIFETAERVMARNSSNVVATAVVSIPAGTPLGLTRMRVMTSSVLNAPTNPCQSNMFNAEVEDYSIRIETNQQPPLTGITVASQITCDGNVQFLDNTINNATSWAWNFGDPTSGASNTSTLKNPTHVFSSPGFYSVTLITCNTFGCDTLVMPNYIHYDPTNAFCTNVTMPANGTGPVATGCNGSVFDPGGATGFYPNNANSIQTIAPASASTVTLTFSAFDLENNFDYLRIYDGPDTSSPLIGIYSGTTLPNGGTITSTSSALTLHFTSDNFTNRAGFAATWNCTPVSTKPVAGFRADMNNICTGAIPFTDLSTNSPTSWLWDFGNGMTSTLKNPVITYSTTTAGSYPVSLIACNSFGCDTIVQTNYVNITVPCLTYCVSNSNNNTLQWIKNVTTAGINNLSGPDPNGYGNYTHVTGNMMLNTTNPITVTLGNASGNFGFVAIWIDFNRDGIFQTSEKVYNAQALNTAPGVISTSGNIVIPAGITTGITRMRVIQSQNFNLNNPCITNQNRAETEDYAINILPNNAPVQAGFTADLNSVCTGVVQFLDASLNGATSWQWNFGNGTTSTQQNPVATYSTTTPGSYDVTLIACKAGVCDTIVKTNYVNITVPCLNYCVSNGHFNTNQWISGVSLGSIINPTGAETNGYGNYTYLHTNLMVNSTTNPFTVTLGNSSGPWTSVAIWIDFNKDGNFQTTERVFMGPTTFTGSAILATGNFSIPGNAQTGFTRMRVVMTPNSNLTSPCFTGQFNTEVEDYMVNIEPNNLPPVAGFTADFNTICSGQVPFTDVTQNGATSWQWNFGNGTTSTQQNPVATYSTTTPGSFDVTLIACKAGVCDTIVKTNYVNITVPCLTYCASSGHGNNNQWIGQVNFGTINNVTGPENNGYGNYTNLSTTFMNGTVNIPVSVTLGNNSGPFGNVDIWIDLNKDGVFQLTEKVAAMQVNGSPRIATGQITIPASSAIGYTRMRVIYSQILGLTNPCVTGLFNGETEDYGITIQANTLPPVSNFTADQPITCNGTVNFTDNTLNNPTSWLWNFGDGNTSTLQNPSHTYATLGTYTVSLTTTNAFGTNLHTKNNYITYSTTNPVCFSVNMPANGGSVTRTTCTGTLYDDGGPSGQYSDMANGAVVIAPTGASTVSLTFTQFELESCCDFVYIYDGPSTLAPLIGMYNGVNLPNNGQPITSTGGALTVRFTSDQSVTFNGFTANWSCQIINTPPVPDFTANPPITCDGVVSFTDASTNGPASWLWNFGDGNTSTQRNPVHTYAAPGNYTVSLTAGNTFGTNVATKTNYISFDPNNPVCRDINMPTNGSTLTTTTCTGNLYDDGGPNNNYSPMADGTVVIAPPGATRVSLTFTEFFLETCCDYVRIYDGPNAGAPMIGMYNGQNLPNGGQPIVSSGGALTVHFSTDGSGNYAGFAANWTCQQNIGIPDEDKEAIAFDIFPNPAKGLVNLRLKTNNPDDFKLEVINVLGQVLVTKTLPLAEDKTQQLDLRHLAQGVYFIRIQNGKTAGVRRIVLE